MQARHVVVDDERDKHDSVGSIGKAQKHLHLPTEATLTTIYEEAKNYGIEGGSDIGGGAKNYDDGTSSMTDDTINVYAVSADDQMMVGYLTEWINAYSFITSK